MLLVDFGDNNQTKVSVLLSFTAGNRCVEEGK